MYVEMLMGYFNIVILFFAINYVDAALNQLWNRLSDHTNRWFPFFVLKHTNRIIWSGLASAFKICWSFN